MRRPRSALTKLAWLASRPTDAGQEALFVLQDALRETYPTELQAAVRKARARARRRTKTSGRVQTIIFAPTLERAIRKFPDSREFYGRNHWPFVVTDRPEQSRPTAVVIWDSHAGWNAHHWAHRRAPGREFIPLYQASQPIAPG